MADGIFKGAGRFGFGMMRLPQAGADGKGGIDLVRTTAMVDRFLAAGGRYFDTAWAYDGSEDAIRQALVERHPRESYFLATKMAAWLCDGSREAAVAQFETSLRRTGAGYFDFYLMHNLGENRTEKFDRFGLWEFAKEQKAAGKIRHLGFSFHSTADELERTIEAHPEAEFVQLQLNYADWEDPVVQSRRNYEVARRAGLPVVVMEPVKGGLLANPPASVQAVFDRAGRGSAASWALRFVLGLEGVAMVLSGMSTEDQMAENLATTAAFDGLSAADRAVLEEARAELAKIPMVPCTRCGYCMKACPANVGIPGMFSAYNELLRFGKLEAARNLVNWRVDHAGTNRPSECLDCGACEAACPQRIPIREKLQAAVKALGI